MASEKGQLVLRWFDEVWNQRRSETIDELMTDQSICYSDQGSMRGAAEFRQRQYDPLLRAFPDLRVNIEGIVEEGDDVVVRWTATGTHSGDGLPLAPTQRPVSFAGFSWIRVQDGKFREGWQTSNIESVLRGLAEPLPV